MARSKKDWVMVPEKFEIYRVIDDGQCVISTLDAVKALKTLIGLIEKHDVTVCWADVETLR